MSTIPRNHRRASSHRYRANEEISVGKSLPLFLQEGLGFTKDLDGWFIQIQDR